MRIPKNKNLTETAREKRRNLITEEKMLWYNFLCSYILRFTRQRVIGNYIVDFYCPKARLIVEIVSKNEQDHYTGYSEYYDTDRLIFLTSLGFKVLRFDRTLVREHFWYVCEMINKNAMQRYLQSESEKTQTTIVC